MTMNELSLLAADGSELVIPAGNRRKKEDSILHWFQNYWEQQVDGSPDGTIRAKKADFELFLSFFGTVVGSDDVDYWTPSLSKSFLGWLQKTNPRKPKRRHKKAYAPSSINRTLATLRHFAKHVIASRPFEAGNPMKGVRDLVIEEPEWNGLSDIELMRLRSALDQVTQLQTRSSQLPKRNRAAFVLAIDTSLRAFELESLDLAQYDGKYLRRVRCKAGTYRDVYVSKSAREELEAYINIERREYVENDKTGPLFVTNRAGRMSRQQIDRFLRQVMAHANSKLPPDEQIKLHAHKLRHTSTKKVYQNHGPVEAKKHSGHQSFKMLERYAGQTTEEREAMRDELAY